MKDLIIIGAGGFGREVAWAVERINSISSHECDWNLLGFLDDNDAMQGEVISGYKVLGPIKDAADYSTAFFVCAIGSSHIRESIVDTLKSSLPNIQFATIVDPSVIMSNHVQIGEGAIVCAHTLITVDVSIGKHAIVNLDCTVGHDAILHDFVTLYPSVNVSGYVDIGQASEIGTGAQIIQGLTIGPRSIVGAGAVVIKNLPGNCTYAGVPANPI